MCPGRITVLHRIATILQTSEPFGARRFDSCPGRRTEALEPGFKPGADAEGEIKHFRGEWLKT